MHKQQISFVSGLALVLVLVPATGLWVHGKPILPRQRELSDQALTLADLKRVRIDITPLAEVLKKNRVKITKLENIMRDELARVEVTVGDDRELPRINLTVLGASDPDVADAVGLTIVLMVNQRATVHRLEQTFDDVPTATLLEHAMAQTDQVAGAVERELLDAMWLLRTLIRQASARKSQTRPAS
jgi:hypothetical protein